MGTRIPIHLLRVWLWNFVAAAAALSLLACLAAAAAHAEPAAKAAKPARQPQAVVASWYGHEHAGKPTASGAMFDPAELVAAHRKLPLGSVVRVTHLKSGRSVVVVIVDRGPYVRGRSIDLSLAAADRLGMTAAGLARVRIEIL
jgi:rare lipoprotein A